jgi:hypothetical protein
MRFSHLLYTDHGCFMRGHANGPHPPSPEAKLILVFYMLSESLSYQQPHDHQDYGWSNTVLDVDGTSYYKVKCPFYLFVRTTTRLGSSQPYITKVDEHGWVIMVNRILGSRLRLCAIEHINASPQDLLHNISSQRLKPSSSPS